MTVGCLIYTNASGEVIHRIPYWPWPAPGLYPQTLPEGAGFVQFFPHNYLRFALGDIVQPFPPVPLPPKGETLVKVIAKNVPISLSGRKYLCDIILGIYQTSDRPAIMLVESRDGSPLATASANAPEGYLQHLSTLHFPAKDYSENSGLWDQLVPLSDEWGQPLFHLTRHVITLGHVHNVQIYRLGATPAVLFTELLAEKHEGAIHG